MFDFLDDLFDWVSGHDNLDDAALNHDDAEVHGVAQDHGGEVRFGGYSNADGTYHWTSDNTDRDPQTGAIIRRW